MNDIYKILIEPKPALLSATYFPICTNWLYPNLTPAHLQPFFRIQVASSSFSLFPLEIFNSLNLRLFFPLNSYWIILLLWLSNFPYPFIMSLWSHSPTPSNSIPMINDTTKYSVIPLPLYSRNYISPWSISADLLLFIHLIFDLFSPTHLHPHPTHTYTFLLLQMTLTLSISPKFKCS